LAWTSDVIGILAHIADQANRRQQLPISRDWPGLFRDKRREDGGFVEEGALASSLYYIMGAISELVRYVKFDASR
jgi:hypothetical protein